jgi:hypothetical protein
MGHTAYIIDLGSVVVAAALLAGMPDLGCNRPARGLSMCRLAIEFHHRNRYRLRR